MNRCIVALLLLLATILNADSILYSENFDSDPSFYMEYTPITGEYFTWSSEEGGIYKVRVHEQAGIEKFTFTPIFPELQDTDFFLSVDFKPIDDSGEWGMSLHIGGVSSYQWADGHSVVLSHNGTQQEFRITDGSGNSFQSPSHTYGQWYTLTIDYDESESTADILIVDRATSDTLYSVDGVTFTPDEFDRFALGENCINNDGNWITLYYDNILLTIPQQTGVVYTENFDSDPSFYMEYTPITGEYFTWSSEEGGIYKVRVHEQAGIEKFTFTPIFPELQDTDFFLSVDFKPIDDSGEWGMSLHIGGVSSYQWADGHSVVLSHNGTQQEFRITDGSGNSFQSPSHIYGQWYTLTIDYVKSNSTADILIVDRTTSDTLYNVESIAFNPDEFDRFALGENCINNDGNWITLYYDNIFLAIPPWTGIGEESTPTISSMEINSIYPNPTMGLTTIDYTLSSFGSISLNVYDITGHLVISQHETDMISGSHSAQISGLTSGVYFIHLSNETTSITRKLVVLK